MTELELYLISGLILLGGFMFILYLWLKEAIDFKLKCAFTKSVGRLFIDKVGRLNLKAISLSKEGTTTINETDYLFDPSVRLSRFLGVETAVFIESIPKNVDLLKGEEKYSGIRTSDIDTHLRNMTEDSYIDWFKKYGTLVVIGLFLLIVILGGLGFFSYKSWEFIRDGAVISIENVLTASR